MKKHNIILCIVLLLLLMLAVFTVRDARASEVHGDLNISFVPELLGFNVHLSLNYDIIPSRWNIYGGIDVLMDLSKMSGFTFNPYRDAYNIGTRVYFLDRFYVELDHTCTHPVYSYEKQFYDKLAGGNRTDIRIGGTW